VLAGKARAGHDIPTVPTELNERRPTVNPSIPDFPLCRNQHQTTTPACHSAARETQQLYRGAAFENLSSVDLNKENPSIANGLNERNDDAGCDPV
jgi:hypothetical protein